VAVEFDSCTHCGIVLDSALSSFQAGYRLHVGEGVSHSLCKSCGPLEDPSASKRRCVINSRTIDTLLGNPLTKTSVGAKSCDARDARCQTAHELDVAGAFQGVWDFGVAVFVSLGVMVDRVSDIGALWRVD